MRLPAPTLCPRCKIPLIGMHLRFAVPARARDSAADVELDRCGSCLGLWFDPGELRPFLTAHGEREVLELTPNPDRLEALDCRSCRVALVAVSVRLSGAEGRGRRFTIHHCRRCATAWLPGDQIPKTILRELKDIAGKPVQAAGLADLLDIVLLTMEKLGRPIR